MAVTGAGKKGRVTDGKNREAAIRTKTAFHEAGHAMMAIWLQLPIEYATIKPDGESLGMVIYRKAIPDWPTNDGEITAERAMWVENQVRSLLAGGIAETIFTGRRISAGTWSDHHKAIDWALLRCRSLREAEAWIEWLSISTRERLTLLWSSVEVIAECLLQRETLSGEEIRAIVAQQYRWTEPASRLRHALGKRSP